MRIGIFVSETWGGGSDVAEVRARAQRAEALGFASAWVPYLPWSLDALASIQAAGDATRAIALGTAVIPTYLFHPLALARQAATVQAAIGRPIELGIGCSNEAVIAMHGLAYERPAQHVREYLGVLDAALRAGAAPAGEREHAGLVQFEGELFRVGSIYGTPGASPLGSVLVGALGPLMLRAAGALADGTIATWSPPRAIERAIAPELRRAAQDAGRPEPRIAGVVPVLVTNDAARARDAARAHFATYMQLPRYRRMVELGGTDDIADACIVGDERAVAGALARYADAGMTDLLAAPLSDAGATWERTAEALAALAR
ncbi:MAG: TIGR03564 family F420-dependent LLM class oxidoreductase [Myxococcota bacterium]